MKRTVYLAPLLLAAALAVILASQGFSADAPSGVPATEGPKEKLAYNPSAVARLNLWMKQKLGERKLKDYHYKIHQNGVSCELCHDGQNPTTPPGDANCIRCHGAMQDMAKITQKDAEKNDLPNPHDSKHYGQDVPCTACHKEHKKSELLCATCHKYTYEKFK